VRIFDLIDETEDDVTVVGPSGFFGEHSLLLVTIHSKAARAAESCELMVVPRESFQELMSNNAELRSHLRQRLEQRMAAENEPATPS
jgi:CRP-like cAMP-binding protein